MNQLSRLKLILFENYCLDIHTDTHTHNQLIAIHGHQSGQQ